MSKKIHMEITGTNDQRNALDVDRWGVHERGYLWAEVDSPDHVHLSLFPLTNLVRVDLDLPREMIQKQPEGPEPARQ